MFHILCYTSPTDHQLTTTMLSIFPDFLTYGLIAPFILRLVLGLVFVWFGFSKLFSERARRAAFFEKLGLRPGTLFVVVVGGIELVGGIFLIIGLFTQAAALVFALISLAALIIKKKQPAALDNTTPFYGLLLAISLSLLFLGAGFFAFDLPI